MYFGLLLMLVGLFLMIWALHYFGFLVAVGGKPTDTTSNG